MKPWYREHRTEIESLFDTAAIRDESTEFATSPSGRYRLKASTVDLAASKWAFSIGEVFDASQKSLATIRRNLSDFPATWVEAHADGHDYLICGEDYQGQTVIQLDTGARCDHIDDDAEQGIGFCWAAHYVSPDHRFLFVDGCYWACPYEIVLFDFSNPMQLPYTELERWPVDTVDGFQPDGSFVWFASEQFRTTDGLALFDMSEEERKRFIESTNFGQERDTRKRKFVWTPDDKNGTVQRLPVEEEDNA